MLAYLSSNYVEYIQSVATHMGISLISVLLAVAIAVPIGILCTKNKAVYRVITSAFGILRIIPSLAVLIFCIPFIGVGVKTAVIALLFLAIPPILINSALAFESLPKDVLEAAKGMGMGSLRILFLVKFPLALPLIFTGVKTAVTEVIASATLAAYIGAGGLGNIIFTGMKLMRTDMLVVGGISVAILSITSGLLCSLLEKKWFRRQGGFTP